MKVDQDTHCWQTEPEWRQPPSAELQSILCVPVARDIVHVQIKHTLWQPAHQHLSCPCVDVIVTLSNLQCAHRLIHIVANFHWTQSFQMPDTQHTHTHRFNMCYSFAPLHLLQWLPLTCSIWVSQPPPSVWIITNTFHLNHNQHIPSESLQYCKCKQLWFTQFYFYAVLLKIQTTDSQPVH